MKIIDKETIMLSDGKKGINILVYVKKVMVRNKHKAVRAFCKIIRD